LITTTCRAAPRLNILPETIAELAADRRVIGVKEASGDIRPGCRARALVAGEVSIWSGTTTRSFPSWRSAEPAISVLANVARQIPIAWSGALSSKATLRKPAACSCYLPLIMSCSRDNPIPVKQAVAMLGFETDRPLPHPVCAGGPGAAAACLAGPVSPRCCCRDRVTVCGGGSHGSGGAAADRRGR
jgi:dihydrodipicolinate synthase/N-acetylneuraminate lyase